jgi:hypothetical protein
MKVVKPGLTSRPTLLGAVGAVALLAMAATATFAAGLPNILPAADPTSNASASASATDRDDSPTATATATATDEASATASDEASEQPKASGSPLIGYCNALNGNALQAITEVVKNKGDKDLPPGLKKVYERLVACPSFTPQGNKPSAAPSDEPSEHPSGEPSSIPTPSVAGGDHGVPSMPTNADGHGRGNGH